MTLQVLQEDTLAKVAIAEAAARKDRLVTNAHASVDAYLASTGSPNLPLSRRISLNTFTSRFDECICELRLSWDHACIKSNEYPSISMV